jgi:transketolase
MLEIMKNEWKMIANTMRKNIVKMVAEAKSGHPGGSLSAADIMTVLYFGTMNVDPKNPQWPDRDRLVLCKGHAAPVLYAALAQKGFFPEEELMTLRKINSRLQGHPDMRKTPGVEASTGSLGQGLSIACGMAIAGKLDRKDYRILAILGDGELAEGQVWEAAMAASHFKLDNLTAILDNNGLQIDGCVEDIMCSAPVREKWEAFGWAVREINGHDFAEIEDALHWADQVSGQPAMIIAHTIKGKGVSFMENEVDWHGKAPNAEQLQQALAELEGELQ